MNNSKETYEALEAALSRILSGNPIRCSLERKLSVRSVEIEANLGNGSAYYYPEFVQKIKTTKKQHQFSQLSTIPKSANQKFKIEKQIKEKYRNKVTELLEKISQMAREHHQLTDALMRILNENKGLKDELAKIRRERMVLVRLPNSK